MPVDDGIHKSEPIPGLDALTEAMQEMKLTEGIIVTRSESQELKTPSGRITVMPAWKFLLS